MGLLDSGLFGVITERIGWLTARQKQLAENVVNANTPRYQPKDLLPTDFAGALRQAQVVAATTNSKHIATGSATAPGIVTVSSGNPAEAKLNGNMVNLESEMMKVSTNAMDYQGMIGLLRKWQGMIRMAVTRIG